MGIAFLLISQVLSLGLGYIIRVVIARNLSVYEFGLFYAVSGFVSFFLIFRDLGFGTAINKIFPELLNQSKKESAHTTLTIAIFIQLLFSTIVAIFLFFSKEFFAKYYFKEESAKILISIFLIYIFFSAIAIWMKIVFRAYKREILYSGMEPLRNIVNLILLFILFKFFEGAIVPTLAISFSWLMVSLLVLPWLITTHKIFQRVIKIKENTTNLMKLGLNVMFNDFSERMITRIDVMTLTYLSTLEKVGIYSAVYPTSFLFAIVGKSVYPIILPHISILKSAKNEKSLESFIRLAYKYSIILTLPLILISIVFAKDIIRILFGQDYVSGYIVFIILLFGALINSLVLINNAFLIGLNKVKTMSKIILITLIFNLVGNLLLIPIMGIDGAAITSAISYIIMFILGVFKLQNEITIKIPIYEWTKLVIISTIILLLAFYLSSIINFNIFIEIILISLVIMILYIIFALILKLINIKEIKNLLKLTRSKKPNTTEL